MPRVRPGVLVAMWFQLGFVTLLAAIAQGIVGFGFTLLAVSFYLLILRSTEAVQLVIIINSAISVVLVGRLWRHVPRRLWAVLATGGLLGFPLGLWVFARADLEIIEIAVAAITIAFALGVLVQESRRMRDDAGPSPDGTAAANLPRTSEPMARRGLEDRTRPEGRGRPEERRASVDHRPASALAIGLSAGALTSSLGMPGPPVALYLTGLRLDKTTFRALALSTFIVMQAGSLLGQSVYVGIERHVWGYALVLVPVAALGALVGHGLCRHVSERVFRRSVLLLLFATGAYMLAQALAV